MWEQSTFRFEGGHGHDHSNEVEVKELMATQATQFRKG
jgi:hypothetical protein